MLLPVLASYLVARTALGFLGLVTVVGSLVSTWVFVRDGLVRRHLRTSTGEFRGARAVWASLAALFFCLVFEWLGVKLMVLAWAYGR
ncbi:MAG TPA: hypothetical protein VFE30_15550 [Anaeromyxobacteraceae bacterium]|jgi:hypothetical protein|nr:hypothetical protein [Anaeromyxobacteraceae bacterium]